MHEGKAESGHYYSYLFNFEKNIWRKFNDIHVTDEPNEDKILQEAFGKTFSVFNLKKYICIFFIFLNKFSFSLSIIKIWMKILIF